MDDLFGKYCYIDTPWIAGKNTRYRILTSFLSNTWADIPISNEKENRHDYQEKVAVVCLDTLVSTESKFFRVKVSDIEIICCNKDHRKMIGKSPDADYCRRCEYFTKEDGKS